VLIRFNCACMCVYVCIRLSGACVSVCARVCVCVTCNISCLFKTPVAQAGGKTYFSHNRADQIQLRVSSQHCFCCNCAGAIWCHGPACGTCETCCEPPLMLFTASRIDVGENDSRNKVFTLKDDQNCVARFTSLIRLTRVHKDELLFC